MILKSICGDNSEFVSGDENVKFLPLFNETLVNIPCHMLHSIDQYLARMARDK